MLLTKIYLYSLQVAKRCLEYFNNYFGKRYPLPKLDLVALNRLSVGAMENWGLITCRENALIVDPQDASPSTLRKVNTLTTLLAVAVLSNVMV